MSFSLLILMEVGWIFYCETCVFCCFCVEALLPEKMMLDFVLWFFV